MNERCIRGVYDATSRRTHQCTRKAVVGSYCKIHSPEYEAKKAAENRAKYEAKWALVEERIANAARYVALREYLIGSGKPLLILNGEWLLDATELDARLDRMRKEQP